MKNTIYFAGTMVQNKPNSPKEFTLVSCSGNPLPYLTTSVKGLKCTAHHANLYALSDDIATAVLVDYRGNVETPAAVTLTAEQRSLLKRAVDAEYFFG